METKKISFGFSKLPKKPPIILNKQKTQDVPKVELIKCLEGQEIKLVEEKLETQPLVIPLQESGKSSTALASLMVRRAVLLGEEEDAHSTQTVNIEDVTLEDSKLETLEARAAKELVAESNKEGNSAETGAALVLPIKADDLPLEGAKESSLDDYDAIPIQQFGLAMLRGMGWTEPPATKKSDLNDGMPFARPKGMGLGADKALKRKPLLVEPDANENLEIKKLAYVRILGGKHKDAYGQIEGFDDDAGRVIVKMAIGGGKQTYNEFLCQPVSKKEYAQYGKCINTTKYEEYKRQENENGQIKFESMKEESVDKLKLKSETEIQKHYDERKYEHTDCQDMESDKYSKSEKYLRHYSPNNEKPSYSKETSRSRHRSRSPNYRQEKNRRDAYNKNDTSESSASESDSDSSYERQKHKKSVSSSHKSHKKKSKKHKKYDQRGYESSSDSEDSSYGNKSHRLYKDHKKKTKKSKKQRSRTPKRGHR